MKKKLHFLKKFSYSIILTLLIFGVSIMKSDSVLPSYLFGIEHLDKIVHLFMYFTLTSAILLEGYISKSITLRVSNIMILIFAILYGGILELIQGVSNCGRSFDFIDIIANSIGTISAYTIFVLYKTELVNFKPIKYLLNIKNN